MSKYVVGSGSGCTVESTRGLHARSFFVRHVSWITLHNVLMSDICRVPTARSATTTCFYRSFFNLPFPNWQIPFDILFGIDPSVDSDLRKFFFKLTADVMWRGIVSTGSLNWGFVLESGILAWYRKMSFLYPPTYLAFTITKTTTNVK